MSQEREHIQLAVPFSGSGTRTFVVSDTSRRAWKKKKGVDTSGGFIDSWSDKFLVEIVLLLFLVPSFPVYEEVGYVYQKRVFA